MLSIFSVSLFFLFQKKEVSLSMLIITPLIIMGIFNPTDMTISETMYTLLDLVSGWLISLTWWIGILMLMCSSTLISKSFLKQKHFLSVCLSLTIILTSLFLVDNVILFYLTFELSLVPTALLILWWGRSPERFTASMYMALYTMIASLFLLLFIMGVGINMSFMLSPLGPYTPLLMLFGITAFLVKLPLYGLHLWLPKAHLEAPLAGSMLLAAVLLKLGVYGLLRIMYLCNFAGNAVSNFLTSIGLIGGVLTASLCLRASDIKKMIAYSSIGHMGLIIPLIMSGTNWGMKTSILIAMSHGFTSSCMFYMANLAYEGAGTRSLLVQGGLLHAFPALSMFTLITCALNMGAPPSLNYLGEVMSYPVVMLKGFLLTLSTMLLGIITGAFNMYLYLSLSHGHANLNATNLGKIISPANYLDFILHITPSIYLLWMHVL